MTSHSNSTYKHIRSEMAAVLGPNEALPNHIQQYLAITWLVFHVVRAKQTHGTIGRVARQRSCKHASLTREDGVFRGFHTEDLSWTQSTLRVNQFSIGDSHGKFVVEEELEVSPWRLNVWFEDFMSAVVQLYLECDSYSSCVKIRSQETDRENFAEE
jgi:hypothetical protein